MRSAKLSTEPGQVQLQFLLDGLIEQMYCLPLNGNHFLQKIEDASAKGEEVLKLRYHQARRGSSKRCRTLEEKIELPHAGAAVEEILPQSLEWLEHWWPRAALSNEVEKPKVGICTCFRFSREVAAFYRLALHSYKTISRGNP